MSFVDAVQLLLQNLIESAHGNWTYIIFWRASHSGQGSLLNWDTGYYKGEADERKQINSSSCSPFSTAEKEYRKSVFRELSAMISGTEGSADDAITEVTDTEWFFLVSMNMSFPKGSGLPGQSWQSSIPIWITGKEKLVSSHCDRAREAFRHGLQTLAFMPSENGVIEVGSTSLNFQSSYLLNKAVLILNFIHNWEMVGPGQAEDESESSNSVRNGSLVNSYRADEELSLGLHLGFEPCPVKPEHRSKSSSSSVGNYPVPVVKEKTQFSGKLQLSSDKHSDSTDINAFIRILKRTRG